jgi:hypothetical protein
METTTRTRAETVHEPPANRRFHRVAVLTDKPDRLPKLGEALRDFAPSEVRQVLVWLTVERFCAPSGTHPPYRSMARLEARNITIERAAKAQAEASEAMRLWRDFDWQTDVEPVFDVSADVLAHRLLDEEIDLLVTTEAERSAALAVKGSEKAACALLLVPVAGPANDLVLVGGDRRRGTHRSSRLIPTLHR